MSAAAVCRLQQTATVAVLGPGGAGVRTLVEAASDIDRLPTDPESLSRRPPLQVGRIDVGDELIVRLLGLSPEPPHRVLWPALSADALGMILVVSGVDVASAFAYLDLVEAAGQPFGVVVNRVDGRLHYDVAELRGAMQLPDETVLTTADCRDRHDAQSAVLVVLESLIAWK